MNCKCHGVPRISNGNHLTCAVKRRASMRRAQQRYRDSHPLEEYERNETRHRRERLAQREEQYGRRPAS